MTLTKSFIEVDIPDQSSTNCVTLCNALAEDPENAVKVVRF